MINTKRISKEYGDSTADYEILMDQEYTVEEFINDVLKIYPNNWGEFLISDNPDSFFSAHIEEREISGRQKVVRGSNTTVLTSKSGDEPERRVVKDYQIWSYSHGEFDMLSLPEEIKKAKITKISGSGGWTRMDYCMTISYQKSPQTIVFATHNENKIKEIKKIVKNFPSLENINFISMAEAGIGEDIVEDGKTYEENALLKARYVCEKTGMIALADDSGVEIEALHGMPGIFSARFLGEQTPQEVKNAYILDKLEDVPYDERDIKYVCCIAAAFPDGSTKTTFGKLYGKIADRISDGKSGFAYDSIVYLPVYRKTISEMSIEEKCKVSHRGKALRNMLKFLEEKLK